MVFYGRSGTGKTTLASTFPGPALLIDIKDQGTDSISDTEVKALPVASWDDFEDIYYSLVRQPERFKSVILDTVSQLQDIAIQHVTGGRKDAGGWGSMTKQDWGEVASLLKAWLIRYRDLTGLGINVCFIAQDRVFNIEEDDNTDGTIAPTVGPRLMPSVTSVLNAGVDVIGHTFVRENVITKVINNKRVEKRSIQYALRVGPHTNYTTKIRKPKDIVVPAYLTDPTYDAIIEAIKGE